jgi:hypothetical protein
MREGSFKTTRNPGCTCAFLATNVIGVSLGGVNLISKRDNGCDIGVELYLGKLGRPRRPNIVGGPSRPCLSAWRHMSSTMLSSGGIRHSPSSFTSSPASITLFRRLVWEGTVPLEIRVDSKELPANSNRGLECYFIQAPRVSYLPLLIPEIKRFLQDVVFDDEAARLMKEEDWWFESEEGHLLKWCVFPGLKHRNASDIP